MKIEGDYLVFSTGKRVYCYSETVGISLVDDPEFGGIALSYGGDGMIDTPDSGYSPASALTKEECVELADVMIARWEEFKSRYKGA